MIAANAFGGRVMTSALLVLAMILSSVSLTATACAAQAAPTRSTTQAPGNSTPEARIQKLRQALNQESQRAIYRWHDAEHPSPPTWFDKLLMKIGHNIEHAWNAFWDFLHKLWPRGLSMSLGNEERGGWQLKDLRLVADSSRDSDSGGGGCALLVAAAKGGNIAFHPAGGRADSRSERQCGGERALRG